MLTKTDTYFLGYRLSIDDGIAIESRWWEIFRRLGWRKPRIKYVVEKGTVLLAKGFGTMIVRREDMEALLHDPDFPRPEPRLPEVHRANFH